ncbi:MAG: hypothetical protein FWE32_07970 [Oscillospiraceae bacterium]|nr:hypothetical protein [Oscillospiraceae bacterium]
MRGNLAKAPLVAVLYASLLYFIAVFLPFTPYYREMRHEFAWHMGWLENLYLVGYALIVTLLIAVAYAVIDKTGRSAFLALLPIFLGFLWLMPMLEPFLLGSATRIDRWDLIMHFGQGAAATILTLLLSMFLYTKKPAPPAEGEEAPPKKKEKVKGGPKKFMIVRLLLFMLLAFPFAFFVFYFVGWYFLAWQNDALRAFYGGAADSGFFFMLISTLLERPMQAGLVLLRGLLLAGFSLLLLLRLPGKKLMYIILNLLFFLLQGLYFALPTALMPWEIQLPHLIFSGAHLLLFALIVAFLLPLTLNKAGPSEEGEEEPEPDDKKGKGKKPASTGKPIPAKK